MELEKRIKRKKTSSIVFLVLAAIACAFSGYICISFLHDSLVSEGELYKIGMVILFVPNIIATLFALICDTVSIVIQYKLKDHRSKIQLILSFIMLFLIVIFNVLFFVLLSHSPN